MKKIILATLVSLFLGTLAVAQVIVDWSRYPTPTMRSITLPPSDMGSSGNISGMSVTPAAGVQRTLLAKFLDLPVTLADAGGACDGSSLIDTFWTALASDPRTLVIASGTNCRVGSNITIPQGRLCRVEGSGRITVDTGKTLTMRCDFSAPTRQVFFGGTVQGMRYNRPEWWGMNPLFNSGFDSAPAFNKALASAVASFDGANIADGGRPTVDFTGAFPTICSPMEMYVKAFIPITLKGGGVGNGGSRIDTCPTFSGGAMLNIHGSNTGEAFYDVRLENFQLLDLNQRSTACIRFVPEGAGYQLNTGAQRPSMVENVHLNRCPIGADVVNTVMLNFERVTYVAGRNNDNIGLRFASAGGGFTSAAGNININNVSIFACPAVNANTCTNTTDVLIEADGSGVANGAFASVAALRFTGQTVLWGANYGIRGIARNGGVVNDVFIDSVQFDGVGCRYIDFNSTGSYNNNGTIIPSAINQVYVHDTYHTTTAAGCTAHSWIAQAGGYMRAIQDHHNTMIGIGGQAITVFNVKDFSIDSNILQGGQAATPAVSIDGGSIIGTVTNIKCDTDNAAGSRWNACVRLESPTNYISFGGNISFNSGPNVSNGSSGANNLAGQPAN